MSSGIVRTWTTKRSGKRRMHKTVPASRSMATLTREVRQIRSVQKQDLTVHESAGANNVDNNGVIFGLSSIPVASRVGNTVMIQSISLRLGIEKNTTEPEEQYIRMLLVIDNQPDTPATFSELLSDAGGVGDFILSNKNYNNRKRFTVIRDKTFVMTNVERPDYIFKYYKRSKQQMPITFDVGTVNPNKNSILLFLVSNEAGALLPRISFQAQLVYNP